MTVIKKEHIFGLLSIPVLLFLTLGCEQTTPEKKDTIKIGVVSALTGNASVYGEPAAKAVALAAEDINRQGGVLGEKIEIMLEDGMCDAKTAANAVNKLIHIDGVKVILGGHCSTESLVIAPVANQNQVIQLASITSSNKFTEAGEYSFRNWPSSDFYVSKLGDIAFEQGARKMALLYEQKDFPVSAMESFEKRFKAIGGSVISRQAFLSSETDFRSYLAKIKNNREIDSIFFSIQGEANAMIYFKTLKELDMLDKYQLYTNNDPVSKKIFDETGGLNKLVYTTDVYVDPNRPKTGELLESYKKKYGAYPQTNNFYVACSYDALIIIRDAINHCKKVDTDCIKQYLYNLKDWQGTAGSLSFDQNGDAITSVGLHYFNEQGEEIWEILE